MKLAKRVLVLVAAMMMVFSLTACGGGDTKEGMKTYKFESDGKTGQIILLDDTTYLYAFRALKTDGSGAITMDLNVKGSYKLDGNVITLEKGYGGGYYTAGAGPVSISIDPANHVWFEQTSNSYYSFELNDEDGTYVPAE